MFTRTGGGTLNCDTCGASIDAAFPEHPRAVLHAQWHAQHDRATEPADAVVQDILDLLEPVYSVSASADMSAEVGERRHDSNCPLAKPSRGCEDGEHSELWVIGGCHMVRPICEACMAECLCSMIQVVRADERKRIIEEGACSDGWMTCKQFNDAVDDIHAEEAERINAGLRDRLDISYLEGREAVQREATKVLTALLADYDACKFNYKTPRGGLVEALSVLAGINADWEMGDSPTAAVESKKEPVTYFHGVVEGDEVEFNWHGVTVRGTVVHPDRNLADGYLDLPNPDDPINGFASYDTRQMQDFRIISRAADAPEFLHFRDLPVGMKVRVTEKRYGSYGQVGAVIRVHDDGYIGVQFDNEVIGVYLPEEIVFLRQT